LLDHSDAGVNNDGNGDRSAEVSGDEGTGDRARERDHAGARRLGGDPAWANRGSTTAKVVLVLIDGRFEDDLVATLPHGAIDGVIHGGPRD
jgi:hypothetical protein